MLMDFVVTLKFFIPEAERFSIFASLSGLGHLIKIQKRMETTREISVQNFYYMSHLSIRDYLYIAIVCQSFLS